MMSSYLIILLIYFYILGFSTSNDLFADPVRIIKELDFLLNFHLQTLPEIDESLSNVYWEDVMKKNVDSVIDLTLATAKDLTRVIEDYVKNPGKYKLKPQEFLFEWIVSIRVDINNSTEQVLTGIFVLQEQFRQRIKIESIKKSVFNSGVEFLYKCGIFEKKIQNLLNGNEEPNPVDYLGVEYLQFIQEEFKKFAKMKGLEFEGSEKVIIIPLDIQIEALELSISKKVSEYCEKISVFPIYVEKMRTDVEERATKVQNLIFENAEKKYGQFLKDLRTCFENHKESAQKAQIDLNDDLMFEGEYEGFKNNNEKKYKSLLEFTLHDEL